MNEFLNNLKFFLVGPYPNGELGGLAINLILSLATMVSGFVLGLLLALGRISGNRLLKGVCSFVIELIRAMPLILLVFWFYFMIPLFAGKPMPILLSAYLSITIYSAVNQAEIFRSGFMNIGKGQWQVAECTGLSYFQSVVYIILPQTLRMMLPSFVSFFISILKDTYRPDAYRTHGEPEGSEQARILICCNGCALFHILLCTVKTCKAYREKAGARSEYQNKEGRCSI